MGTEPNTLAEEE